MLGNCGGIIAGNELGTGNLEQANPLFLRVNVIYFYIARS